MKKVAKKTTEKYLTEKKFGVFEHKFEGSMQAIAKSFSRVEGALDLVVKEIRNIHEDSKNFRNDISSLNNDGLSYDRRIENLTTRVEKLEAKYR